MDIKQTLREISENPYRYVRAPEAGAQLCRDALAEIMALEAQCAYQQGRADGFEKRLAEATAKIRQLLAESEPYDPNEM